MPKDIILEESENGMFSVPDLTDLLGDVELVPDLHLPDVGSMIGSVADFGDELTLDSLKMVRGAMAIQEAAATVKMIEKVVSMQLQIKESSQGNLNYVRVYAGPGYVNSAQLTPFWKIKEDEINLKW